MANEMFVTPLQGLTGWVARLPRAVPWAILFRPFGARRTVRGRAGTWALTLLLVAGCRAPAQPREDFSDDPEAEKRLLVLPEGFETQLVASEPDVINPVQINFDPQGRLWVLCLPRYPQLLPGQDPRDYVLVLEDFDAKG